MTLAFYLSWFAIMIAGAGLGAYLTQDFLTFERPSGYPVLPELIRQVAFQNINFDYIGLMEAYIQQVRHHLSIDVENENLKSYVDSLVLMAQTHYINSNILTQHRVTMLLESNPALPAFERLIEE
jgi:hypothetical protein